MAELKGFNRDFEKTFGFLKPSQMPSVIDWANRQHLYLCFPQYKREQIKHAETNGAPKDKKVDLMLDLMTPTKDKDIFVNTKLSIDGSSRIAVFGENGSGKTMLFHAISTAQLKGFPTDKSVHHMQEMSMDPEADKVSVMETIVTSHPMGRVLRCMEEHLKALLAPDAKHAFDVAGLKSNLEYVERELQSLDFHNAEENISKDLRVLGFDEKGEKAPMSSLSGGLRMRVALAAAFFIKPELLLLDEPTNHLDLPSVLWLENKLRGYKDAFLLVTHDRHLLENTVRSVLQIQDMKLIPYSCGFHDFEKEKKSADLAMADRIDKFLKKNQNIDPCSPEYKMKIRYQTWQQKQMARQIAMQGKFTFKAAPPLPCPAGMAQGEVVLLKLTNVRFSYDVEKGLPYIFDTPVNYEIRQDTRVGVMGPNGAGKSTLLKLITGKIFPTEGELYTNPDFTLAYFGQHSTKELKMEETPLEFMMSSFPKANKGDIIGHMEKTTIDKAEQNTRMANLSFSKRSCVIFSKLTFIPPHLLIMDEPTNFLDLDSVDALISAANKFPGALITVTHNRDFLKRTSKHFLSLVPGAFLQFSSMKDAERATYSFIDALERGEQVDHKTAIQENRGGGAIHTKEYLEAQEKRRAALAAADKKRADEAAAKLAEEEAVKAAAVAKLAAKVAAQKTDWAVGDKAWAPVPSGKITVWVQGVVKRNIPAMGVTVEMPDGKNVLVDAKKLKQEDPTGDAPSAAAPKAANSNKVAPSTQGGKGGNSNQGGKGGKGGNSNKGGKGGKGGK